MFIYILNETVFKVFAKNQISNINKICTLNIKWNPLFCSNFLLHLFKVPSFSPSQPSQVIGSCLKFLQSPAFAPDCLL